jgi:septal ring factor EnvC (AmiA/AmiB activator)
MEKNIKDILNDYVNFFLKLVLLFILLYGFFYFMKPNTSMSDEDKKRIDSILIKVDVLSKEQEKIDTNIALFENDVQRISNKIDKLKKDKTVIREVYHEEILRVSTFNDAQIDSFFTARYGHNPH